MKTVIIQGSANPNGNTQKIVADLQEKLNADVLDLSTKNILSFDYQFANQEDDFSKTIHEILDTYDAIIFATPVYWYTMSGILKNFFDRFTDGLLHDKTLGRKFEGKKMGAIACGSDKNPIESFFVPFQKSAVYLKMNYLGDAHLWISDATQPISEDAAKRITSFTQLFI